MRTKSKTLIGSLVVLVGISGFTALVSVDGVGNQEKPPALPAEAQIQPVDSVAPVTNGSSEGMTALQVITINAKGGYSPVSSIAKANTATVLNIKTDSTFDCSAVLVIPMLGYRTRLPFTGATTINVPPQQPGSELTGLCGMGMYSFTIKFVS